MGTFAFWAAVIAFGAAFPRAADRLGGIIAYGFILPFLSVAMGSVTWGVLTLIGYDISWLLCVGIFGLPFAALIVRWVVAD